MYVIYGCVMNNIKMGQEMELSEFFSNINRIFFIGFVYFCLLFLLSLYGVCLQFMMFIGIIFIERVY